VFEDAGFAPLIGLAREDAFDGVAWGISHGRKLGCRE
jgi:hypothetical protein